MEKINFKASKSIRWQKYENPLCANLYFPLVRIFFPSGFQSENEKPVAHETELSVVNVGKKNRDQSTKKYKRSTLPK